MLIDFFVTLTPLVLDLLEKMYPPFTSGNTLNDKAIMSIDGG